MTKQEKHSIRMVDVSQKERTTREAVAVCSLSMAPETLARVLNGQLEKGNALEVARVAAITGAKKTPDLVPLCHPIALSSVEVGFEAREAAIEITTTVRATDRTGVEMEALVAASAAALTIYDMIKSIDRGAEISNIRLVRKSGGRSGIWERQSPAPT